MAQSLMEFFRKSKHADKYHISPAEFESFVKTIEKDYLSQFLTTVIRESEEILSIDPTLSKKEILEIAAQNIVKDLNARAATIRLFDSRSMKMLTFGSHGFRDYERLASIPVKDSIAGEIVRKNSSITVPNILQHPLYKNKKIIEQKGFNSLLAVPLLIPGFVTTQSDVHGSLQIYYSENNREFNQVEIIRAEMLARRVSYVLAKKKILDLHQLNLWKEKIVDKIFVKLSNREGIKLKDFFVLLMPELENFIRFQNCSFFTLTEDQKKIYIETSYPVDNSYYDPAHSFTVSRHPYFNAAVHGTNEYSDRRNERLDKSYVLIKDPLESKLVSSGMRSFAKRNNIHSILLVPLKINEKVRHILTFYATDQKQYFTEEEIELLTFLGKEIMKASKLEFLSDLLHDIKNPVVAVAGLAARARKKLDSPDINQLRPQLIAYMDVVARETARIQDLALTLTAEGREEVVDLNTVAKNRYQLNQEVIRESAHDYIDAAPPVLTGKLPVYAPLYALERVLDNLLNNATKAIPSTGGKLAMKCYRERKWACITITNTGAISPEQAEMIMRGDIKGRGLHIVTRFIKSLHGELIIHPEDGVTRITIKLPLYAGEENRSAYQKKK